MLLVGPTDTSSPRHNYALPDIAPVDLETPNCTLVETSTDIDSDKYNNLKGKVNNNTASFTPLSTGWDQIFHSGNIYKNVIIKLLVKNMNCNENAKPNETLCENFTYGNKNSK